jgi:hypothetical protein
MAQGSKSKWAAPWGSPFSVAPLVCMDCGQRHYEQVGSYRAGAHEARDCATCGEGPLLDIREPGVIEALRERDQKRHVAQRRRVSMAVMGVSTALAIPIVGITFPDVDGLIAMPFLCALLGVAMVVVALLLSSSSVLRSFAARRLFDDLDGPALRDASAVESTMRRGWGFVRFAGVLAAAALVTAAIPALVSLAYPRPQWCYPAIHPYVKVLEEIELADGTPIGSHCSRQ